LGKKYFSASESEKEIVTLEEFQEMLDELFLLNGVLNIGDWIPWLDFLDMQGYVKRMKELKVRFDRFHDHVIDEHNAKRKATKNWQPKDMVDLLLQLADDPELEVKLTRDNIKGLTQVFFFFNIYIYFSFNCLSPLFSIFSTSFCFVFL